MFSYVTRICTSNNCAVKCKVSTVRSLKSSGKGFVGKCAYTHDNEYDAHLNEQVVKGRVPTTGTFVKLWSLWLLATVSEWCTFLQIIIATCLLLTDCLQISYKSKGPPVIIYLRCRGFCRLHDLVILYKQKDHLCVDK